MDPHVDVVKNEWLAGFQYVVARVWVDAAQVVIDSPDPDTWMPILERPLLDRTTGELVYAEKDPDPFLSLLADNLPGTYLFATEPHTEEQCPYLHHPVLPIKSVEDSRRLQAV